MARLTLVLPVVAICCWALTSAFNANRLLSPRRQINLTPRYKVKVLLPHPEQRSKYQYGDIRPSMNKIAVNDPTLMWPRGEVPYVIHGHVDEDIALIESSMAEFTYYTCITFVPMTNETVDYVNITADPNYGCSSLVGRQGGEQIISLLEECMLKPTIVHELMHAIGFYHEHSRPDRNDYVDILTDNILEEQLYNFDMKNASDITDLQTQYDYESIMHYDAFAFAVDTRYPTMVPTQDDVSIYTLGDSSTLSQVDTTEVIKFYQCTGPNGGGTGGNQTVPLLAGSCNFDTSQCGWTNVSGTPLTWKRSQGATPTIGTGPDGDKTSGKGYYMLMEGSESGALPGDNAQLLSPPIYSSSDRFCIEVSYHKQGSKSVLNISLVDDDDIYTIHTVSEDQGEYWKKVKLRILEQLPPGVQILIEAFRGEDFRSDVAVDDIFILPDFC